MNTKLLIRIQTCCLFSALGLATFILFAETGRAVLPEGRSVDIEAQSAGVSLSWLSITNAPYAVQGRTNLMQGIWGSLDTIIGAGGTSVYPVVFTDSPSRFFRVLFPQPFVQAGEPAFVQSAGGATLYISGQFFYAGDLIRVGGVLLSNVTFLSSTLLSGTLPPQSPGLYDIEVLSGQSGAVLAVLHDAVQVSPPFYQTVQEPPEWPPAGPSPAFGKEFKGHVSLLKAFDDEPPPPAAKTHTKSGHVSLLKAFDDGSSSALIAAFLSKKGYDYYQSQSSLNAARSHTKTGHVTLLKAFDDDPPNAARKDFKGHVTLLKAFDDEPPPAAAKTHTKTGHVTLMKAFDDDAGDAITGKKDFKGHVTLMKAYDDTAPELRIHSGELQHQVPDLAVAGRGLDFVWMRTYRSLTGTNTTQGARWTHSYDVRCVHNGEGLDIYDGTGRRDTFRLQADGTYACPGFFREGIFTGGVFRLTFADSGFWEFYPLDSSPAAGKLSRIEDRNGNALTLSYDGSGRLVQVTDTLGRGHVLQYTPAGRIASVTDCTGRTVTYSYYAGEPGGSVGDLKSVTSPPVTGTPNGNDFPTGKTITYTYTSGNSDERMNHLMLTVRDALGQLATQCTYDLNPASATFLRANTTSCGSNPPTVCTYIALTPSPDNRFAAMRCIVNDPVGNVTESFFDLRNRCVTQRELTGRAVAGLPVTASDNRPTGKLRTGDPDLYETQLSWNNDSLCTRIALPSGLVGKFLHAGDQGILIRCRKRPDLLTAEWDSTLADDIGADTDGDGIIDLTKVACHYTYDPRFGSDPSDANVRTRVNELEARLKAFGLLTACRGKKLYVGNLPFRVRESPTLPSGTRLGRPAINTALNWRDDDCEGFCTSVTDPRGYVSTAEYDEHGNLIYYQPESSSPKVGIGVATPSAFFAYDAYGQLIAITNAPEATDRRCVTTQGWLMGHLHDRVVDAAPGGLHLTTTFERDARGNVTRCIDPKGNDTRATYNALDQMVSCSSAPYGDGSGQRITTTVAYDANDNVVQIDTDNRRDTGAPVLDNPVWTTRFGYDGLSRCVSVAAEVDASTSVTNRFEHDANGQLTALLSPPAADGTEPFNRTAFTYDERGLLFRMIEAPGSSVSATTEYSYTKDFNPATKKYVDDTVAVFDYDGLDRVKSVTDALGNTETYCFDAPGNLTVCRSLGETTDLPGSTSNRRLSESRWTYDGLDRCVERIDSFFDIFTELPIDDGTRSTRFAYSPDGRCASITNDAGHACSYTYDTAGRLASVTGPRGDTRVCVRDANGNVTRVTATDFSDVSSGAQIFVGDYSYDGMDRRIRASDNVGNTNCWFYDSQSCLARYTDPRGNETRYRYDGRPRRTATLSYIGPCDADADGVDRGITISTSHVAYDTAGRVIAETDANTNTTVYAYDVRDRLVAVTNADGTVQRLVWSPRSNLTREEDANGTAIDYSYDPLNRLIRKQISAGFMVEPTTTFESFAYDGLSRLVAASNDLSQTAFTYDSLGNTASSVQDGRTVSYTCDSLGNRRTCSCPSGYMVHTTYDALNRPAELSVMAGGVMSSVATFAYDGPGRLAKITRANGINTRVFWNGLQSAANAVGDFGSRQVSRINHARAGGGQVVDQRACAYDRNQNKTQRAQTAPFILGGATTTNTFGYDSLDRMTRYSRKNGALVAADYNYRLDGKGNRLAVTNDFVSELYSLDAMQPDPADFQMDQYTQTPFAVLQTYDANGCLLSRRHTIAQSFFHYDYADRLVQVDALDRDGFVVPQAAFDYDALGRRVVKTVFASGLPPVTTQFVYSDGEDEDCDGTADDTEILETYKNAAVSSVSVLAGGAGGGAAAASYARMLSPPAAFLNAAGELTYTHCDDLGNVLALTDAGGNVLERCDYSDFGEPTFLSAEGTPLVDSMGLPATSSPAGNPFLFRGMQWDGETELYIDGSTKTPARYLDPKTGRYLSRKGGTCSSGQCAYTFAGDNPWSLKKEEGGRHTPFHNKYRPQFAVESRDHLKNRFEDGDIPAGDDFVVAATAKTHTKTGHVTLMK